MIFPKKLINRYHELKKEVPDCILLMQVGAFMQVMDEDAKTVSSITGLTLQVGGSVDTPIALGGFPQTGGLNKNLGKLVRAGYSVAIALQDETKERYIEEIIRVQKEIPKKTSIAKNKHGTL
jgi:DNA mismatch repair ATPase MutS